MKVSKPVLIFGIVVLLVAGYIQFFTGKKKPKGAVQPPAQAQVQPADQQGAPAKTGQPAQPGTPQQAPAKPGDTLPAQPLPKPQFDKIDVGWASDPFALPVFTEKRKKEPGSAVRLVAILEKGGSRVAVIDKDVVKKGDLIGSEKVVDIGKDRVVLARGGIRRTLVLADPDTVTQESKPAKEEPPKKEKPAEKAK